MSSSTGRRIVIVAGALAVLSGAAPAAFAATHGTHHRSAAAPGSALGALDLQATAYGLRAPLYSTGGEDVEVDAPYAASTLELGGVGHGVTSVMWPGDTGAHGGDVLDLLNVPVPASVKKELNDPVKAEAQTSVGKPTVSMTGPGYAMTATATQTHVSADSHVGGTAVPVVGKLLGMVSGTTDVRLTGPRTAVATAVTTVRDVSIAKVLTIDQITSTATAVTKGKTATARTTTSVTGAAVAGIPVTIDGTGIHLKGKALGTPLGNPDSIVDKALSKAGISVRLTRPKRQVKGALATVDSGTLRVDLSNPNYGKYNDTGTVLILGGVDLQAGSGLGFPYHPPTITSPPPSPARAGNPAPASTGSGGGGSGDTSLPQTGSVGGGGGTASAPTVASPTGASPIVAAASFPLFGGVRVWWAVLVLLGAGLLWLGLRRLPDHVLDNPNAVCRWERP